MNCGAVGTRDDQLLLFLHADSQLPVRSVGFCECITFPCRQPLPLGIPEAIELKDVWCRYDACISGALERYSARMAKQGQWGCFSTIELDVRT